ncbi:autotransporter outer membrane beta-barrel domain-containing protein [Acidisoma sp. 7E03]
MRTSAEIHGLARRQDPCARGRRVGLAVGTVDGQIWTSSGSHATGTTAQLFTYGQWQNGPFFLAGQLGGLYQQEDVSRSLPIVGVSTRGDTNGTAGGGRLRVGVRERMGAWLFEPSLGFGGFRFQEATLTESGGGALAQTIGGQSIGSAQSVLGINLQRPLALFPTVAVVAKGSLG